MQSSQAKTAAPVVVLVDPLRRWTLYSLGIALLMAPLLILSSSEVDDAVGAVIAIMLVILPLCGLLLWIARRTRLVLTNKSIRYINVGISSESDWTEIEALVVEPLMVGLVLKRPSTERGIKRHSHFSRMSIGGAQYYSERAQRLIADHRFIDLRAYGRQLRRGTLQKQLTAIAPHLRVSSTQCH